APPLLSHDSAWQTRGKSRSGANRRGAGGSEIQAHFRRRQGMIDFNKLHRFSRIYDLLLYAYPRDFRSRYGTEMRQTFHYQFRDSARLHGSALPLCFFFRTAWDWLATAIRERALALWPARRRPVQRSFVAEWILTIVLYLFATTTLMQAYVIPTGSMEGS